MNTNAINAQNGRSVGSRTVKPLLKSFVLASLLLGTGCASWVGVGESNFKCSGENNEECKSAREVYELTHDGQIPDLGRTKKTQQAKDGTAEQASSTQENATTTSTATANQKEIRQSETDPVVDNYVAPRLPDRPIPVRTPAHVMRIWVAPWEDTNGDLITNGYVYTEIEPRRWVIGKPESQGTPMLRPLQTIQPAANLQQKN